MNRRRIKRLFCLWALTSIASTSIAQISEKCLGTGHPVYLIGGGPAFTTWNLAPVQEKLADHYRVCRWDMRGVGDNSDLAISADRPALSQWIQDMASTLPQEPVVLWGHSWGALQALLFAREYPERVKALVLNNPVDPELKSLEYIEYKRYVHPYVESKLDIDDIGTAAEQRHRFRSKIASYFMDAKQGWRYSAMFGPADTNNALNVRIWDEYRQMPLNRNELARLAPKISRLIYCSKDVLMPESFGAYSLVLAEEKHVILENCAHFPWVESPDAFYKILLQSMHEIR